RYAQHQEPNDRAHRRQRVAISIDDANAEQPLAECLTAAKVAIQQAERKQRRRETDQASCLAEARSPVKQRHSERECWYREDEAIDGERGEAPPKPGNRCWR